MMKHLREIICHAAETCSTSQKYTHSELFNFIYEGFCIISLIWLIWYNNLIGTMYYYDVVYQFFIPILNWFEIIRTTQLAVYMYNMYNMLIAWFSL